MLLSFVCILVSLTATFDYLNHRCHPRPPSLALPRKKYNALRLIPIDSDFLPCIIKLVYYVSSRPFLRRLSVPPISVRPHGSPKTPILPALQILAQFGRICHWVTV